MLLELIINYTLMMPLRWLRYLCWWWL